MRLSQVVLAAASGVQLASQPTLRNVTFSGDCSSNTADIDTGNIDFQLFNISTVTPIAGHGVCEAVLSYEDWPVGYSMAITDATLRGHLKLPKATKLFRFKTTVFTTFPSVAEFVLPDLAREGDFDGYIQAPALGLDPQIWTSPCRLSDEEPGNWTVTIRTLADVQVTRRSELEPGAVAYVPARLAVGTPPLVIDDDVVKLYLNMQWKPCAESQASG
ncbi:uncharacterized protein CTRU02_203310 [Colletotrichum truncatum]|uniref:Uncharacterized protein n=1 Tax=Colletotrichum truncatum TaxID=5467 RepID=A0ACC3Z8W2_COLTU|nr:uncharacterized protein CTRU02_15674 [Colletotrichum truncatum]KAF6780800.1 hypothetical protein CTRU02_15674 [Colletotrichum truncatum]